MTNPCRPLAPVGPDLFDETLDGDPWIAFHGTTNTFESEIDRFGLNANRCRFTRVEIADVVALFEGVGWAGEQGGGFAVLKPFSLDFDRSSSEHPRLCLAESSYRASLYATQDFSGGEAARALRYSFQDLGRYADGLVGNGTADQRQWVRHKLEDLSSVERTAKHLYQNHEYGVVYAVRMTADDLPHLKYDSSMGVIASMALSPDRLLAKVAIPKDWRRAMVTDWRRINRGSEEGLIAEVIRQAAAR
jgi:hypothetical protein